MPDAATERAATGYERGTVMPFGSATAWPVVADVRLAGRLVTLGSGEPEVAIEVAAEPAINALGATVAALTDPAPGS